MTKQQIAANRFKAYDAEMIAFTFGEWAHLSIEARNARQAEIDARHNYKHGWMLDVDGVNFCREAAFPGELFPHFPADQGLND